MPGRYQRKLARGRRVEEPGFQDAVIDHGKRPAADAFAVERMRAQPALAQRVVDDADAFGKNLLPHAVLQEAGLARNRGAVDRRGEMPDQRAGDARVEHDRHAPRLDLARIETLDRALAGIAA